MRMGFILPCFLVLPPAVWFVMLCWLKRGGHDAESDQERSDDGGGVYGAGRSQYPRGKIVEGCLPDVSQVERRLAVGGRRAPLHRDHHGAGPLPESGGA